MAKIYVILTRLPDGDTGGKLIYGANSPQEAVDIYKRVGYNTPIAWTMMEPDEFKQWTRAKLNAWYEEAADAGREIKNYVANIPLDARSLEDIYNTPITPGPRKPKPVICPEIWAKPDPNTDYMAAVRAMCMGGPK